MGKADFTFELCYVCPIRTEPLKKVIKQCVVGSNPTRCASGVSVAQRIEQLKVCLFQFCSVELDRGSGFSLLVRIQLRAVVLS